MVIVISKAFNDSFFYFSMMGLLMFICNTHTVVAVVAWAAHGVSEAALPSLPARKAHLGSSSRSVAKFLVGAVLIVHTGVQLVVVNSLVFAAAVKEKDDVRAGTYGVYVPTRTLSYSTRRVLNSIRVNKQRTVYYRRIQEEIDNCCEEQHIHRF